jgi:hypothetical protein
VENKKCFDIVDARYKHEDTYTYSFTDPSYAQVRLKVEFVMKRAKLQYAIMSNQEVINYIKLVRT